MFPLLPSKSMMDYMNEVNRLFPRTSENDTLNTFGNPNVSPFSPSAMANRSSSSADSTSPESYASGPFPSSSGMYRTERVNNSPRHMFERSNTPSQMYQTERMVRDYSRPMFEKSDTPLGMYQRERTVQDSPRPMFDMSDTPLGLRRQRPIIGRKILPNPENLTVNYDNLMRVSPTKAPEPDSDMTSSIWQPDEPMMMQHTPPNVNNIFIENKNYTQNVFYELFPSDNRGFQFKTPVKAVSPTVPTSSNVSPNMSLSPNKFMLSPDAPRYPPGLSTPPPQFNPNKSPHYGSRFRPPARNQRMRHDSEHDIRPQTLCTFCRKNGETPIVYMAHSVRERVDGRQVVTCPILRSHVCAACGAFGDDAHTITYCPVVRSSNNGHPVPSTTITLKNTRIKSNGRRRF